MVTNVFSGVSNMCCKCFNSFRHMLQVFHLAVANVDLGVAYVAVGQPPVVATEPAFMRMGVEGAPRCGRGTRSTCGPWCERGTRSGTCHSASMRHGAAQTPT
jgi:hypothetical protein